MPRGRGGKRTGDGQGLPAEIEDQSDDEANVGGATGGTGGTGMEDKDGAEPTIVDLVSILRTHMGQQQAREARWEQEAARQEKRFKALQHQFGLLQLEVQARTPATSGSPPPQQNSQGNGAQVSPPSQAVYPPLAFQQGDSQYGQSHSRSFKEPKLQKLTDGDDIEHFLITFERIAVACQWPKEDWGFRLIPLLTGKARSAYVHMDFDESLDYDKVKCAILKKYDINPESYRQRFRSLNVEPDETPKELYVRLKELYGKWVQPRDKTVDEIGEIIILEQYLRMLSPELQVWIKEHDPRTAAEAASLADVFVAARRKNPSWVCKSWKASKDFQKPVLAQQCPRSPISKPPVKENRPLAHGSGKSLNTVVCYLCGQEGHTKPACPQNPVKLTHVCYAPRKKCEPGPQVRQALKETLVEINGRNLRALIDTGSNQTLVHRRYIPPQAVCTIETVPICCVHGDEKPYPTADVYVKVQGQTYLLNVGVTDNLPFPVVLGHDLPVLLDLIQPSSICSMALTRAQARASTSHSGETDCTLCSLPFYDAEVEAEPGKSRKSRRQRRQEKFYHTEEKNPVRSTPELPIGFQLPVNMVQLQQEDASLADYIQRAKANEGGTDLEHGFEGYILHNGLLYYQHRSRNQLVVPKAARQTVLALGHSIPWAGHLGKHKTTARIHRYFHWPGLRKDVAQFCRSCPQCQQTTTKRPTRAPLQPLPVINTPFERLGMDVVGPVERSKSGNRFMLVVTDYATKYPEVFPLKSVKAKTVAWCLVQFFSRVGFPKEILTDQGTNFMSKLLKDVYQLLGIKGLRTTPYHPQTDGLTERFNQTLKQMLCKFVDETGSDWDQWLPYLLFAYREVPQASTGFSPFELLFGHEVRGPLTLLKEMWEGPSMEKEPLNVVSYVLQMREKLEKMTTLAQEHMAASQFKQKAWYDRLAKERSFEAGQKVLVMLPTQESKLLAKWQGPYEVIRKISPTTYEISTPGRSRPRILHINLLKEWIPRLEEKPVGNVMLIRSVGDEEVEEQYLPVPAPSVPNLDHLTEVQQSQVRSLFIPEVFQENPGHTTLVEHDIVLKKDAPVRRLSYRIPERLLGPLEKEINLMLSLGIIEPSKSEWCNPVVLVPKKDGTIRFCIDFRYLNAISKFDSYPTPRIDDLIEHLGKAKYLTTIDLCKGYWQVPLAKSCRELTAFKTPWGLYHFTVMPFGVHGGPATFQRLVDRVLGGMSIEFWVACQILPWPT